MNFRILLKTDGSTFFLNDKRQYSVVNTYLELSGLKPNSLKRENISIGVRKGVEVALCDINMC